MPTYIDKNIRIHGYKPSIHCPPKWTPKAQYNTCHFRLHVNKIQVRLVCSCS
uniref:Uncharacterized protein n=1 Tax=Anguilla anguilla TaxID=7936 RepID=A0A0E9UKH8_ANGAN